MENSKGDLMKDYLIVKGKDIGKIPKATVDNSRMVSAKNLDNLRKNLSKELSQYETYGVYARYGGFLGVLGRLGKKTITLKTKDGKTRKSTWPELMWITGGKDYACSEKTGKIRRM